MKEESGKDTEATTGPFTEFNKDTTYKDVMELYKDSITDRTEEYIHIENITIFDDITGFCRVYFDEGAIVCARFHRNADFDNNISKNREDAERIIDYYDEVYGSSTEQWYVKSNNNKLYDAFDLYKSRKWIDYDGLPLHLWIYTNYVGLSNNPQDENITIEIYYNTDYYHNYLADYIEVSKEEISQYLE